jgi:hypothetical protein
MSRTTLRRQEIDACRVELAVAKELYPDGHVDLSDGKALE